MDIRTLIRSPGSAHTLALRSLASRCGLPDGLIYLIALMREHVYQAAEVIRSAYQERDETESREFQQRVTNGRAG